MANLSQKMTGMLKYLSNLFLVPFAIVPSTLFILIFLNPNSWSNLLPISFVVDAVAPESTKPVKILFETKKSVYGLLSNLLAKLSFNFESIEISFICKECIDSFTSLPLVFWIISYIARPRIPFF